MMRLPSEKFIGVSFKEYTSPETAERLYGIFNELYRTGESAEYNGVTKLSGKMAVKRWWSFRLI